MRLLINTASTNKGGGVQVAASFLNECRHFGDHEFGVVAGSGLSKLLLTEKFPENFTFFQLGYRPAERVFSMRRAGGDLDLIESRFEPDVVFTTSGPSYWHPGAPHLMGFNLPHHLYPNSPYFSRILKPLQQLRWRAKSVLIHHYTKGYADAWVVQTDDANQRLRRWISSERVYTVPNTVGEAYYLPQIGHSSDINNETNGRSGFRLLVLSSYYPHKNLEILNGIIALIRARGIDGVRFTMTLPTNDFEKTIFPENRAWVDNVGPQSPDDCPRLYQRSDALFLPSLLECFSANYVEAMAMKRPIITTDLGFARTICSNAALYFEPLDPEDALRKILELRADTDLRQHIATNGQAELRRFGTPRERAEAYLALCQELVDQQSTSIRAGQRT